MKRPILYSTAAIIAMMGGLSVPQANATIKVPTSATCYISSFYAFDACTASCNIQLYKSNTPGNTGAVIYSTTVSADGFEHCSYLTNQLKARAMNALGCQEGNSGGGGGC